MLGNSSSLRWLSRPSRSLSALSSRANARGELDGAGWIEKRRATRSISGTCTYSSPAASSYGCWCPVPSGNELLKLEWTGDSPATLGRQYQKWTGYLPSSSSFFFASASWSKSLSSRVCCFLIIKKCLWEITPSQGWSRGQGV